MPTSPRAPWIGLPTLRDSSRASSSPCSSTSVASRRRSPARSVGATARQAGNASFARATAASVSSTPAASISAIVSSVAGLTIAVTCGPPRRAARRGAGPRRLLDARARRRRTASSGSSTASTMPSSAQATSRRPVADSPEALVVMRLDRRRPRSPIRDDGSTRTACSENSPATARCSSCPTTSGRCWTRSPPRATFRTSTPRQIASTGRSRASAAVRSASSPRSRAGLVPLVVGIRLRAVGLRLQVVAAGEDEPVERVEHLVDSRRRPAG